MKAKVIKAAGESALQERIDIELEEIGEGFVDIKIAGAFDGKDERFVVIILYQ